jgi:precorrin-2 dehydrogenase/sirohydrochlorin ferrochelatase
MGYFPIFLDLAGRSCVVIGGGEVAERKVQGLLDAGAAVTVISPHLISGLAGWAREGKLRHEPRNYRPGDLRAHELAFAATDDGEVNEAVFQEGRDAGVWVNAADDPAHCDFILPSVLRRGELVVAVASGGGAPGLSRAVREELEIYLTDDYAVLSQIAAEVRRELKGRPSRPRAEAWRGAFDGTLRRLVREGRRTEARDYLLKRVGGGAWR